MFRAGPPLRPSQPDSIEKTSIFIMSHERLCLHGTRARTSSSVLVADWDSTLGWRLAAGGLGCRSRGRDRGRPSLMASARWAPREQYHSIRPDFLCIIAAVVARAGAPVAGRRTGRDQRRGAAGWDASKASLGCSQAKVGRSHKRQIPHATPHCGGRQETPPAATNMRIREPPPHLRLLSLAALRAACAPT